MELSDIAIEYRNDLYDNKIIGYFEWVDEVGLEWHDLEEDHLLEYVSAISALIDEEAHRRRILCAKEMVEPGSYIRSEGRISEWFRTRRMNVHAFYTNHLFGRIIRSFRDWCSE